ncbi:biogenesis of lysosome-related organelles complex 1 subunit 2-like [Bolinopsis microptera]|uniref:biogenesis of lysosome-related organelles complex 1 subunit 2-like n=1 Tax=Bolinopsis microptera TaxID=2820187 RepID=UPI00307A7863
MESDQSTAPLITSSQQEQTQSKEDKGPEQLEVVSHELFDKLSTYLQAELSGTKDTYALLEELNTIAIDQYTNLSHSTTQIKDSLHDLDVKYKLLLPYLEQLNQLDVSVASLEQATLRLDAYTKVLESKFKKLEKR